MAWDFRLPDIGEGVVEGEIVRWLVNEGDSVEEDQPLVEVMTDKATVTIPSPKRGRVAKRHGAEGSIAKVHEPLVTLELEGEAPAAEPQQAKPAEPERAPQPEQPAERPPSPPPRAPARPPMPAVAAQREAPSAGAGLEGVQASAPAPRPTFPPSGNGDGRVLATPLTRRLAREYGVDLHDIRGTGPQGRVMKRDVFAYLERTARPQPAEGRPQPAPQPPPARPEAPAARREAPPAPAPAAHDERMPIRGLRRAIWKKMTQSEAHAVPFTYVDEVDCTELVALRDRLNARIAADGGARLTYLPFIVKALIAALRRFPHLNAIVDEQTEELVVRREYNIGIGVATDAGLTVAVMHGADRRTLGGVAEELERLAQQARAGKLTLAELQGGTFTITSLGRDGGMFATPVINHPEVGILGVHRIEPRPVVVDGQIVVRQRTYMSCSFDHRVIDGHVGAAFVGEIKRLLESPDLLMLSMT